MLGGPFYHYVCFNAKSSRCKCLYVYKEWAAKDTEDFKQDQTRIAKVTIIMNNLITKLHKLKPKTLELELLQEHQK